MHKSNTKYTQQVVFIHIYIFIQAQHTHMTIRFKRAINLNETVLDRKAGNDLAIF